MKEIEQTIQEFEKLRNRINEAEFEDFDVNREIFNDLKTKLIENGFDFEVITIDSNNKFFTPTKDFERTFGFDTNAQFKDAKGKLAALCTKAIRDLKIVINKQITAEEPKLNTIIKTEKVYPPTSWKLLRNGLFWTILLGVVSLTSIGFYNSGQNSKEKENAELVNENSEKKAELKEISKELKETDYKLKSCIEQNSVISEQLSKNKSTDKK